MKRPFRYFIAVIFLFCCCFINAQGRFVLNKEASQKIKFEFTSNLIIIPVEINGVELSFVLDSGVSRPILFNLTESDSLDLKNTKTFFLHGLGAEGSIKALRSSNNHFKIGEATHRNQELYVIFDQDINFTPRLGVHVHGIIGYDVFKDFVVEINYNSRYIRLHNPETFKAKTNKKWVTIPLDVHNKKPYLNSTVQLKDQMHNVKLLIDTGSSDALWLFEDEDIKPNIDLYFIDYLGKGLSGSVYGKRSKVQKFGLSDFELRDVNVAFPDSAFIDLDKIYEKRNGSLGGEILKRFNLFVDYGNSKLYLKKNGFFKDTFTYNNSGIVLEHNGTRFVKERIRVPSNDKYNPDNRDAIQIDFSINYRMVLKPIYKIVELRESSNAYAAGLREGDIIISINGKEVYDYKLPEINKIFHGKTGKAIKLKVDRYGLILTYRFKLDNAFKKNEPSN